MASCKPGKTPAKDTVSRDGSNSLYVDDPALDPEATLIESALALITPGWAAAFASPPAAMSFAMIAAGAAAPPTPTINIHLKRDSSTLLERKSNKLHTFSSFQESLHASKKSSAANLKDKAAARATALAVACDFKQNNKISSRRAFARNMQLSKVDRRARFDFIAQHRRCTVSEDPLKLERDKQNSVLALEALSSSLVNEDDDQDAFVNVDFNTNEMWLYEDIQTRPSATAEQQWTFHITKSRISLLINTDGMVR
ncbi:hypothetical protein Tco_1185768 [Tanacetum coccineum]